MPSDISVIEDKFAIRELVARYNFAIDEGRPEEWAGMFTPDGTFEAVGIFKASGRDGLIQFCRNFNASSPGRHYTTDAVIEIDGDTARQRCYLLYLRTDDPALPPTLAVYDDRLIRTADGWRFVSRQATPTEAYQRTRST